MDGWPAAKAMIALRRHQLVWLETAAWQRLLAPLPDMSPPPDMSPRDPQSAECLQHWASHELPLVVARRPPGRPIHQADHAVTLGLAAPLHWGRRRLFVEVRFSDLARMGSFAGAGAITPMLPAPLREDWSTFCAGIERITGAEPRVYGSYGWQQLTRLAYVHEGSDIDLLVAVGSAQQADRVAARLEDAPLGAPRIDGELTFPDGTAVAWREWALWRSGNAAQILIKRVAGAALVDAGSWTPPA